MLLQLSLVYVILDCPQGTPFVAQSRDITKMVVVHSKLYQRLEDNMREL